MYVCTVFNKQTGLKSGFERLQRLKIDGGSWYRNYAAGADTTYDRAEPTFRQM